MTRKVLVALPFTSLPAHADGAPFVVSWMMFGGPVAPLLASIWGLSHVKKQPDKSRRVWGSLATVCASAFGCYLGFEFLMDSEWINGFGHGILFGPALFGVCAVFGRIPSLVLEHTG
jgi:hypothetical protein